MKKARFRTLWAMGCVVALMVAGATPAFAHHKEDHSQDPSSEAERFDETDDSSEDEGSSKNGKSRRNTSDSQTTTTSSSDDGTADGAGKNYDREGEPRGETSTSCPNDKSGASDPRQVYDNTCDGRAGKAGSGGGSAQGRPCAGCVGNADDKNPRGQMNDGDHDGNAGYECDGNNGVARDNPAHTGCPTPPSGSSTPMCPTNPLLPLNDPGCDEVGGRIDTSNPVKVCPEGPFKGMPFENPRDCEVPDRVLPNVITDTSRPLGKVAPPGGLLPFTGTGNALSLIGIALVLIAGGTLVMRTRRKEQSEI